MFNAILWLYATLCLIQQLSASKENPQTHKQVAGTDNFVFFTLHFRHFIYTVGNPIIRHKSQINELHMRLIFTSGGKWVSARVNNSEAMKNLEISENRSLYSHNLHNTF